MPYTVYSRDMHTYDIYKSDIQKWYIYTIATAYICPMRVYICIYNAICTYMYTQHLQHLAVNRNMRACDTHKNDIYTSTIPCLCPITVHVCVCVYIRQCVWKYMHIHLQRRKLCHPCLGAYIYIYIYICACVYMCIYMYLYTCVYIYIYIYIHIYICIYVYIYIRNVWEIYTYMYIKEIYIQMHICICIYICIYIYIYICMYVRFFMYGNTRTYKHTYIHTHVHTATHTSDMTYLHAAVCCWVAELVGLHVPTCDMTHPYVCQDSLYVWHDSFISVTWLIHMYDMTHPYVCHDSSYVWHDSFIRVPGLIIGVTQLVLISHTTHPYT